MTSKRIIILSLIMLFAANLLFAAPLINWGFEGNNPTSGWGLIVKNNWTGNYQVVTNGCNGKSFQFNATSIGTLFNNTTCYVSTVNITLQKDSVYRFTFTGRASNEVAEMAIVLFNSATQQIAANFTLSNICANKTTLITHSYNTSEYTLRFCFKDKVTEWYQLDDVKLEIVPQIGGGDDDDDETEILDFKPSNPNATVETKQLYDLLLEKREQGILFGHHMTISQGKNFRAIPIDESNVQSDVYTAVNDFPAISSFDFARGFEDKLLTAVKKFNSMGGIVTFSFHMNNPVTDGGYNDTSGNPVTKILTDQAVKNKYKSELDKVASFCDNAKIDGKHIPIIFRPFHEHTGDWFWWGMSHCSDQEYIELWQLTYNYLVNTKGLNNLLFAFSPSKPSKYAKYEIRYPGNDFVDICGFDYYEQGDFSCELIKSAELCYNFANKNGKIAAITEFGVSKGLQNTDISDWYMSAFLELIKSNFFGQKMTYAVTWMNSDNNSYWIPTNGDLTYDGFVSFYNDPYSIFLSNISDSTNTKVENAGKSFNDFKIYPNPVSDNLIIEHTGAFNSKLNLYNAFGQLVSTHYTISEQSSISFRDAEKGMYFIEILDEKSGIRQYFKIIKK